MNTTEVLYMLEEISKYLDKKEYKEAENYIKRKKEEINNKKDPSSEYMDKLIQDLKWNL